MDSICFMEKYETTDFKFALETHIFTTLAVLFPCSGPYISDSSEGPST